MNMKVLAPIFIPPGAKFLADILLDRIERLDALQPVALVRRGGHDDGFFAVRPQVYDALPSCVTVHPSLFAARAAVFIPGSKPAMIASANKSPSRLLPVICFISIPPVGDAIAAKVAARSASRDSSVKNSNNIIAASVRQISIKQGLS